MDERRNITSEEDEALILDSVREFLKRDVAPHAHELEASDEYLSACATIISERPPERTRVKWNEWQIERVSAEMAKYPFLAGYVFENPGLAT